MTTATHFSKSQSFKVIIVDDELIQRKVGARRLQAVFEKFHLEYSIHTANNGEEGWALCEKGTYDFYVIDYQMPGMNGIELSRKVLEENPKAHIILYSSSEKEEIAEREKLIAGDSLLNTLVYIQKDITELSKHLEQWVSIDALTRRVQEIKL